MDYYAILGILPSGDFVVIRAAFRALAQKYHPDKWTGEPSEANRRMRELNEAYDVLSDEHRRERYDSQRKRSNADDFDFDDTMRSAFREAESSQESDWTIALSFYPDLDDIYKRMKRTSDKLAFAFLTTILESKEFEKRHKISEDMERNFLHKYFGKNDQIIQFAKELIRGGHKQAAKELNRTISVIGNNFDSSMIIHRIKEKYFPVSMADEIRQCAKKIIDREYVSDAERLISLLGGAIEEKAHGLFSRSDITVFLLGKQMKFDNHRDMVLWLKRNVAQKYL
jgi:curved DNA-binding protein CbpA